MPPASFPLADAHAGYPKRALRKVPTAADSSRLRSVAPLPTIDRGDTSGTIVAAIFGLLPGIMKQARALPTKPISRKLKEAAERPRLNGAKEKSHRDVFRLVIRIIVRLNKGRLSLSGDNAIAHKAQRHQNYSPKPLNAARHADASQRDVAVPTQNTRSEYDAKSRKMMFAQPHIKKLSMGKYHQPGVIRCLPDC